MIDSWHAGVHVCLFIAKNFTFDFMQKTSTDSVRHWQSVRCSWIVMSTQTDSCNILWTEVMVSGYYYQVLSIFVLPPPREGCRRRSVFGCVRPWVRLCVPKNLWTPYLRKQWREFHPILVTDVFCFTDLLVRFWGQEVKDQGHSRRINNRWRQPVEFCLVFPNLPKHGMWYWLCEYLCRCTA